MRTDNPFAGGQQGTAQRPLGVRPAIDADKSKVTECAGRAWAEHAHAPVSQHEAAGEIQGDKQAAIEARAVIGRLQGAGNGFRLEDLLAAVVATVEQHLEETAGFLGGGVEIARWHDDVLKAVIIGDFHHLIDATAHRIGQEQVDQFHGNAGRDIPGTLSAGLPEGEVLHAHGLADHPVQGGIEVFAGNRLDNGAEDKPGGYGVVGLGVEATGFCLAKQINDLLGAVQDIRLHLCGRAGNASLMGQQVSNGGASLAVLAVLGQVAGDRVIQVQLPGFHQMMDHHGGHHLGGGKQADRGVRGHDSLTLRVRIADAAIQHNLAVATQAQADGRAHAAPVKLAGSPPDGVHLFRAHTGFFRRRFLPLTDQAVQAAGYGSAVFAEQAVDART